MLSRFTFFGCHRVTQTFPSLTLSSHCQRFKKSPFKTKPGNEVLTSPLHRSSRFLIPHSSPVSSSLHLESTIIGIHASMKSQKQFFQLMQLLTRGFGIQPALGYKLRKMMYHTSQYITYHHIAYYKLNMY